MTFRPTHDVGPRTQCISGLNHAAYGLPVNASRPGSPQAHASLGSGWRSTLAGWDWLPTGFRTRFQRSHHGILSPLTGLSRHTRCCTAPTVAPGPRQGVVRWGGSALTTVFERAGVSRITPPVTSMSSQVRSRISCLRQPAARRVRRRWWGRRFPTRAVRRGPDERRVGGRCQGRGPCECQGRSKTRPRWRRKTRPSGSGSKARGGQVQICCKNGN